jgi:hypothetical protein
MVRATSDGPVSTPAGSGSAGFADCAGAATQFNCPTGVVVGDEGHFIIAEYHNHRVRRIAPDDTDSTLAGSGREGFLFVMNQESEKSVYRVVYYESRKRQLEIRLMNEGRYNERLKAGVEGLRILLIMNQESES